MSNFTYRKAKLNITVDGFGDGIREFYIDGKRQQEALAKSSLKGRHDIRIVLNGQFNGPDSVNFAPVITSALSVGSTRFGR